MNDTPAEVARAYRLLIMSRSGEERFVMGSRMFDAARAMILASLPEGLSDEELRRRLFARVYPDAKPEQVPDALKRS